MAIVPMACGVVPQHPTIGMNRPKPDVGLPALSRAADGSITDLRRRRSRRGPGKRSKAARRSTKTEHDPSPTRIDEPFSLIAIRPQTDRHDGGLVGPVMDSTTC
jgi:hypothetical protein